MNCTVLCGAPAGRARGGEGRPRGVQLRSLQARGLAGAPPASRGWRSTFSRGLQNRGPLGTFPVLRLWEDVDRAVSCQGRAC